MPIPNGWTASAVDITCRFESSGDLFEAVEGDFDKMGISCGCLQWNIGQGSLQPMVQNVGKAEVQARMPTLGADMWAACASSIAQGLKIVRGWQKANSAGTPKLLPVPKAELKALMGGSAMRAEQQRKIDAVADQAMTMATNWAKDRDNTAPDKRLFCWMFDVATQNGSLEGQTPKKVSDFIAKNKPDKVDDLVCDYLASFTGPSGHVKDAHKNAALWRNNAGGEKLELLCLSYLRAQTASSKWRHVVVNRKGSIAMGGGWVNSGHRSFASHGL